MISLSILSDNEDNDNENNDNENNDGDNFDDENYRVGPSYRLLYNLEIVEMLSNDKNNNNDSKRQMF